MVIVSPEHPRRPPGLIGWVCRFVVLWLACTVTVWAITALGKDPNSPPALLVFVLSGYLAGRVFFAIVDAVEAAKLRWRR